MHARVDNINQIAYVLITYHYFIKASKLQGLEPVKGKLTSLVNFLISKQAGNHQLADRRHDVVTENGFKNKFEMPMKMD